MKKTAILAILVAAALPVAAQDLSMSAADAQQQQQQAQPEAEAQAAPPAVESKYDTPSKSYKAERNAIRSGNKAFEKEQYHEALEMYDKALEVNAGSIRGRYNKAVALLQLQSDDNKGTANDPRVAATALFEEVIPDAKNYDIDIAEKSLYNLGNMAFNDEQYDRSIEMYKSALRINPDNMLTRENLRLAQLKKQEQENQNQQDKQEQDKQEQQQQQQQQQEQQQQEQEQQQQQQQPQPMTQSAQQILQSMQNKENQTRKKVQQQEVPAGRPQTDKPW